MLIKITGSTDVERQRELYKMLSEKLLENNRVYMVSSLSWQESITNMFSIPEFNVGKLRSLQSDEFVLSSITENPNSIKDIKKYYNDNNDYNIFILDKVDDYDFSEVEDTLKKLKDSNTKIIIINSSLKDQ